MAETLGDYKLLRRIATGGMGEVYLAELRRAGGFRKAVALKTILPAMACRKEFAELFEGEAAIAASLNHVNIVHVFDYGRADGRTFMTLEFVEGPDMDGVLAACPKEGLPLEVVAEIGLQACRGLAHAHERRDLRGRPVGVVHGDVSPANFLLSMEGQVKLADFGLARLRSAALGDGSVSGKFSYMSPEQSKGESLSPASDLFSLGAVLYEMLAGRRAFPLRDPPADTLHDLREARHVPLGKARPDLPQAWCDLVEHCLELVPESRPVSAQILVERIQQIQKPCGPEGLTAFLLSHADQLPQTGQLGPDPTEVAQHPVAADDPPRPRTWRRALIGLFVVFWGVGFAWWLINPVSKSDPGPPKPGLPKPPAILKVKQVTAPAPTSIVPNHATDITKPSKLKDQDKDKLMDKVKPEPRPRVIIPVIAKSAATLQWPKNFKAWVNHHPVSGHRLTLRSDGPQLVKLLALGEETQEIMLRLQPPAKAGTRWMLSLRATPWMRLRIGDQAAGQTPRSDIRLPWGDQSLMLEREGKSQRLDLHLPNNSGG